MSSAVVSEPAKAPAASGSLLSKQALAGLSGIFIAAMMSGLNNRVGSLGLADVRGVMGASLDDGSWLTTAYAMGELIAMPFAAWLAITYAVLLFHFSMVSLCALIARSLPFIINL
jgi:DHA2 family multidrug resistance protein